MLIAFESTFPDVMYNNAIYLHMPFTVPSAISRNDPAHSKIAEDIEPI